MSAATFLIVLCDHPGCEAPEGHCPVRFEPHTHHELHRLLKAHGWRRARDGRDLCPDRVAASSIRSRPPAARDRQGPDCYAVPDEK